MTLRCAHRTMQIVLKLLSTSDVGWAGVEQRNDGTVCVQVQLHSTIPGTGIIRPAPAFRTSSQRFEIHRRPFRPGVDKERGGSWWMYEQIVRGKGPKSVPWRFEHFRELYHELQARAAEHVLRLS